MIQSNNLHNSELQNPLKKKHLQRENFPTERVTRLNTIKSNKEDLIAEQLAKIGHHADKFKYRQQPQQAWPARKPSESEQTYFSRQSYASRKSLMPVSNASFNHLHQTPLRSGQMYGSQYTIQDRSERRHTKQEKNQLKSEGSDEGVKYGHIGKTVQKHHHSARHLVGKKSSTDSVSRNTVSGNFEIPQGGPSVESERRINFANKVQEGLKAKPLKELKLQKKLIREFDEEDYLEYEDVIGKKIRDLNRQRNFMIETVKKDWKMRKASHYKVLDNNPRVKYGSSQSVLEPTLLDKEFTMPLFSNLEDEVTTARKKMRKRRNNKKKSAITEIEKLQLSKSRVRATSSMVDLDQSASTEESQKVIKFHENITNIEIRERDLVPDSREQSGRREPESTRKNGDDLRHSDGQVKVLSEAQLVENQEQSMKSYPVISVSKAQDFSFLHEQDHLSEASQEIVLHSSKFDYLDIGNGPQQHDHNHKHHKSQRQNKAEFRSASQLEHLSNRTNVSQNSGIKSIEKKNRRNFESPKNIYYQPRISMEKYQARALVQLDPNLSSSRANTSAQQLRHTAALSPNNSFRIKYTPMQLYPKMLKVKVEDKQLGKSFRRAGKEDVASYMEQTDRMVHQKGHSEAILMMDESRNFQSNRVSVDPPQTTHQYPFIDKGQLAMIRGKPKASKEHEKYIKSMAEGLIKNAGKQYESFIKKQMNSKKYRKLMIQNRLALREKALDRIEYKRQQQHMFGRIKFTRNQSEQQNGSTEGGKPRKMMTQRTEDSSLQTEESVN